MKVEMALQMQVRDKGWGGEKRARDGEEKVGCKLPFNKHNKVSLPDGDQSQLAILGTFLGVCMRVCVVGVCNNACNSAVGSG